MDSKSSPNLLAAARKSLLEIENVSRTVSSPTPANISHIAKGIAGLLLLYLIQPALRVDFRALMTLSEITLEGEFDQQTDKRLPDPDQPRRKTLRAIVRRLGALGLLEVNTVGYSDPRLSKRPVLDNIPHDGIICWAGAELYVKRKPNGQPPEVFAFKTPGIGIVNWQELRKMLPSGVHASRVEVSTKQLDSSLNLIKRLCEKNLITDPEVTRKIDEVRMRREVVRVPLAYLSAATEEPRSKIPYILPMLLDYGKRDKRNGRSIESETGLSAVFHEKRCCCLSVFEGKCCDYSWVNGSYEIWRDGFLD